jgi:putative hemolysin
LVWNSETTGSASCLAAATADDPSGPSVTTWTTSGRAAASAYRRIAARHLSPPEYRAEPFQRLPCQCVAEDPDVELPPLIRGYLCVGAYVCSEPAWDPDSNTADLLMLLPLTQLNPRHARHYLGDAAARAVFAPPTLTR